MKIKQVSIFLENKVGHLSHVCKILSDANINVVNMMLADTKEFGILRLIVKEPDNVISILASQGITAKTLDVVSISVADEPGGLQKILVASESAGLAIDYMYAFPGLHTNTKQAIIIIKYRDIDYAISKLQNLQIDFISFKELCE